VDAFDVPAWIIDDAGAIQHGNLQGMDWVASPETRIWMRALHEWLQNQEHAALPEQTTVSVIQADRQLVLYRGQTAVRSPTTGGAESAQRTVGVVHLPPDHEADVAVGLPVAQGAASSTGSGATHDGSG
jgi:hypothetical protein